jgi:DNA polymerase-3 subunit alpha
VVVDIPASACTTGLIAHLKQLLALHPGSLPVVLRLTGDGSATRLRVGDGWRVSGSPALLSELRRLVGPAG